MLKSISLKSFFNLDFLEIFEKEERAKVLESGIMFEMILERRVKKAAQSVVDYWNEGLLAIR